MTRVTRPLGLVNKAGVWYLVASGTDRGAGDDPAVFRAGRVTSACLLAESFDRPAGFDLATFWERWSASFVVSRPKVAVRIRASAAAIAAFPEVFGDMGRHVVAMTVPDESGCREVTLTFEHEAAAVQRLAGFGGQAEVLSPETVRESLVLTARQLLERYQTRPAP